MKSADERLESLERQAKTYRILFMVMLLAVIVSQRHWIVGRIDTLVGWVAAVAQTRPS